MYVFSKIIAYTYCRVKISKVNDDILFLFNCKRPLPKIRTDQLHWPFRKWNIWLFSEFSLTLPDSLFNNNIIPHALIRTRGGHEGKRSNGFCKIQLLGQKCHDKTIILASTERDSAAIGLVFKAGAILYLWAITYGLGVAQPIRTKNW